MAYLFRFLSISLYNKMEIKQILLFLGVFVCTFSQICQNQACAGKEPTKTDPQAFNAETVAKIEDLVVERFWYFLKNSHLVYLLSTTHKEQVHFSCIHRNAINTLLTIVEWDPKSQDTEINTLVRIGNGEQATSLEDYPQILSLRLNYQEYFVEMDESGNLMVNGAPAAENQYLTPQALQKKFQEALDCLERSFPLELEGASVLHEQPIITTDKLLLAVSYHTKAGKFFGIVACNNAMDTHISLFMKLPEANHEPQIYSLN